MFLAKVLAGVIGEGQLTVIDAAGKSHVIQGARPGPAVTMQPIPNPPEAAKPMASAKGKHHAKHAAKHHKGHKKAEKAAEAAPAPAPSK